ncbi:Ig-specific serine endopeptidase MIP [Mycoplasmopsis arginini]|uniref:Ig-specific serine endopeptidase MIP n=1 Tax=Mycoplasmopsis arginini TaxID=2094 RepID=UPI00249F4060|nr:DUF31 family protein [Mycoplasmopsis arginini]MDI3351343.1 hypothetical protein [Mycoplasmopsis arginini]MDI3351879.1 hypothetical protein [Mycoplasmopsis arginini]
MKQKKNNKKLFLSLLAMPLFVSPALSLIACESDEEKEKNELKKSLDKLSQLLVQLSSAADNATSSQAYTEGQKSKNEAQKLIDNNENSLIELRKAKNNLNSKITAIETEIANIKKIKDQNESEEKPNLDIKYSDEEFEADVNELASSVNVEEKLVLSFENFLTGRQKEHLYASELQKSTSNIGVKAKKESLNEKINFSVENVIAEDNANQTGTVQLNVVFKNKATLKRKNKIYNLSGLKTSIDNTDHNGDKPNNKVSDNLNASEVDKYIALTQKERFEKDNEKYVDSLKKYLAYSAGVKNWTELRKHAKASAEQIATHNKKAQDVGQDSYESAAYKGFTLTSYRENGEVDGLEIIDGPEMGKQASLVDSLGKQDIYKTNGLARTIVNQKYLDIAKQTFSITLHNIKDFKDEIAQAEASIKHWEDNANEAEYKKLIDEKIKELQEEKVKVTEQWDKKISENQDQHLTESLQNQKTTELKKYDDTIAWYQSRTRQTEIDFLKQKIEEYKEKAAEKRTIVPESGTAWIMDFQLDESGYPTKWYLGTNSHVAKALTENLTSFSLTKIDNNLKVGSKLRISQMDDNITRFSFESPKAIRKVFDGIDYLNSKPSDFLSERQKQTLGDLEEFVDFAVLEIDFTKINKMFATSNDINTTNKYPQVGSADFAKELAKIITNNYANTQEKHIKFKQNSYLKDYKKIDYPIKGSLSDNLDFLYAVGWPSSREDYYLKQYIDDDQRKRTEHSFSLWINSENEYYGAKITDEENGPSSYPKEKLDRGNFLSYQIGYRSFIDKPGVLDTFIAIPKLGKDFYYLNGKRYVNMALAYMPRRYAPTGGSSGTSIRNQNNELVSVFYASNSSARVGISAAFRSEGYDYKGLYGKYNLPQYDLIYGGGQDQKNSYREALKEIYKDKSVKTNLFKNGLDNVPYEFKFIKTNEITK